MVVMDKKESHLTWVGIGYDISEREKRLMLIGRMNSKDNQENIKMW